MPDNVMHNKLYVVYKYILLCDLVNSLLSKI